MGESTMTATEYKEFLSHLFNEHVQPRLRHAWDYWNPPKYPWRNMKNRLQKASSLLRYINEQCAGASEVYGTFRPSGLEELVEEIRRNEVFNTNILERSNILGCLDTYYDEIVAGLNSDLFSNGELQLLKDFGVRDPSFEVKSLLYFLQRDENLRRPEHDRSSVKDNLSISEKLERVEARLNWADKEVVRLGKDHSDKEKEGEPSPTREAVKSHDHTMRIFKGLAEITVGTALSLGDIALMIGAVHLPVSTETESWGVFVSTSTGIGKILKGVGELRGE